MVNEIPDWRFFTTTHKTWAWANGRKKTITEFVTLKEAVENARIRGFDGATAYWTVATDRGTTHYHPGQPAVRVTGEEHRA